MKLQPRHACGTKPHHNCYCSYSGTDESELSDLDGEFNLDITSRHKHEQAGNEQDLEGRRLKLPLTLPEGCQFSEKHAKR